MTAATLTPDGATLKVAGVLDFETVVELLAQGREWIETAAPAQFTIDLAGVEYSSSAGLALLLEWLRVAERGQKRATLAGMPADMQALVRVGGLEPALLAA